LSTNRPTTGRNIVLIIKSILISLAAIS
jgi:hypothetical protein